MNYLKKKINKHKASNRNHDDDDVYDYIPAVPPHPSELGGTCDDTEVNGLSEEEIKRREEKRRQLEEKKRQQEESKKSQEAWKFFEQLNQRVSDTVSKTQIVIDTLKDSTTADELTREAELELGFVAPDSDDEEPAKGATFTKGSWVAFDDRLPAADNKTSIPSSQKSSTVTTPLAAPVTAFIPDHSIHSILAPDPVSLPEQPSAVIELFDDFGFDFGGESSAPGQEPVPTENEDSDDPFDTSHVNISVVEKKIATEIICNEEVSKKPDVIVSDCRTKKEYSLVKPQNLDFDMETNVSLQNDTGRTSTTPEVPQACLPPGDPLPDPDFDADITDLYLQQNKKIHVSRYGSSTSLASILSNPFLNDDFQDDYNPDNTSISGSATPTKRRGSTNPFEDSPVDDAPAAGAGASAIAALTADFCFAMETAESEKADSVTPEPFSHTPDPRPDVADEKMEQSEPGTDAVPQEPEPADETAKTHESSEIIETEDVIESQLEEDASSTQFDHSDEKPGAIPPPPPPSAEPFDPFATIVDDHHEDEPDHLSAPPIPDYPSDVSDVEEAEVIKVNDSERRRTSSGRKPSAGEGAIRRRSSAFETRTAFDHSSKRSSLSSNSSRRASVAVRCRPFDPFQQVDEDSATPPREDELLSMGEGPSTGEPSPRLLNQAFEDFPPPDPIEQVTESIEQTDLPGVSEEMMDEDPFPPPPPPQQQDQEPLDFSDPTIDPFDTTNFSFEPVKDAVEITDTGTFDAFTSRFQETGKESEANAADAFASPLPVRKGAPDSQGAAFDTFDPYAGKKGVKKLEKDDSHDSFDDDDGEEHFKIVIKAKMRDPVKTDGSKNLPMPLLPPPPKTPVKSRERGEFDEFESFLDRRKASVAKVAEKSESPIEPSSRNAERNTDWQPPALGDAGTTKRQDSTESPSTPLYDTDVSQPLEEFPAKYEGDGWEMFIRYPAKKKLTGQRFWKKIFVRVSENSVIQLFNTRDDNDPFQELPLQPSYSLSEISAQQYDQFGKIFTVKLQYVFYRERVGVRKGQIAKVIQGQITSFGSIAKLGMPLDHAPQVSELIKLGTQNYDDARSLQQVVEEVLFRMPLHRDRALTYKTEEIQLTVADDYYVEQNRMGIITKQLARVRIFFIAFLNGMPGVEIGVNDLTRQGKEVVGRHDIIPVVTEEWIRLEDYEFHSCVMVEEFEKTRTIRLIPPDACYFELMRFRVRPPRNRELPLQVSCNLYVTKTKVELRCEVLVPGAVSRKHGQIPCEDIVIRVHIPECWIYFFRTEKHMRFGSVKSAARRPGKIKVSTPDVKDA